MKYLSVSSGLPCLMVWSDKLGSGRRLAQHFCDPSMEKQISRSGSVFFYINRCPIDRRMVTPRNI